MNAHRLKIASDLHRVGGGYAVQFVTRQSADGIRFINCEWSPSLPTPRERRRKVDMQRYTHALMQFVLAVAAASADQAGVAPWTI